LQIELTSTVDSMSCFDVHSAALTSGSISAYDGDAAACISV
jgi:hypothetical protein